MNTLLLYLAVQFAVFFLATVYVIRKYNTLVELRNRCENAFSQIDVQLKRRHNLIPNLVETAKGYLQHERETLEAVVNARNDAQTARDEAAAQPGDSDSMQKLAKAESSLSRSMSRLMGVAEDYPQLRSDQTMRKLMEELRSTENKVAFARQAYNDAVMRYNTERASFPTILLANIFTYEEAEPFELELEEEREAIDVTFGAEGTP